MKDIHKNDRLIAFAAGIMAIISLAVAVIDGYENRKHNRLSVKPYLDFSATYVTSQDDNGKLLTSEVEVVVENRGLGPAIIKDFQIITTKDGIKSSFTNWPNALKSLNYTSNVPSSTTLGDETIIQTENSRTLVVLDTLSDAEGSFQIKIIYESIYEEQQIATLGSIQL